MGSAYRCCAIDRYDACLNTLNSVGTGTPTRYRAEGTVRKHRCATRASCCWNVIVPAQNIQRIAPRTIWAFAFRCSASPQCRAGAEIAAPARVRAGRERRWNVPRPSANAGALRTPGTPHSGRYAGDRRYPQGAPGVIDANCRFGVSDLQVTVEHFLWNVTLTRRAAYRPHGLWQTNARNNAAAHSGGSPRRCHSLLWVNKSTAQPSSATAGASWAQQQVS